MIKLMKEVTMSKQTAVQMLFDYIEANMHEDNFNLLSAKQTALAMEKEQIESAFLSGQEYEHDLSNGSRFFEYDYYNETYGTGNNL